MNKEPTDNTDNKNRRKLVFLAPIAALSLSACGGVAENGAEAQQPSPVATAEASTPEEPELDLTDIATYELRPEPLSDPETAWTYMREQLDRLGSTPQVEQPAYEFTDKLYASEDPQYALGADDFEQLSKNVLIAVNFVHANRDVLSKNPSALRGILQDIYIDVSFGNPELEKIQDDSFTKWIYELADQIPEGQTAKEFTITSVVNDPNDWDNGGTFGELTTYSNDIGGVNPAFTTQTLYTPYVATDMNPDYITGSYTRYEEATAFDGPVQVGFR